MTRFEYSLDMPGTYGILATGIQPVESPAHVRSELIETNIPSAAYQPALRGVLAGIDIRHDNSMTAQWATAHAAHAEIVHGITGNSQPGIMVLHEHEVGDKVLQFGANFTVPQPEDEASSTFEDHDSMLFFGGSSYSRNPESGELELDRLSEQERLLLRRFTMGAVRQYVELIDPDINKTSLIYSFRCAPPYTEFGTIHIKR